jgi:hydrogenase maturation protease
MNTVHTLVIACGNPLRGDDAVGPTAADIVSSWEAPGVKVLTVHQLVPELIDEMQQVQRVLFIDAATNADDGPFQSTVVEPMKSSRFFGHYETAANLLALLHELGGPTPDAWLVSISALSFDHGMALTVSVKCNMHTALVWIRGWLAEASCMKLA